MNGAQSQSVWRFAPSPNGYLHLGHAYSALRNFYGARACGGRFLLRIEDIDIGRARPEFEQAIYDDLAWLGLEWETPVRRQSQNFADYALAVERLDEMGLVYPCFCTRADIAASVADAPDWPRDPDGAPLYPGTCRDMSETERRAHLMAGRNAAMRLDMNAACARAEGMIGWTEYGEGDTARDVRAEPQVWGDVVLARRDVPASYHVAVVIDDALQGVTDVARGMDLFQTTSVHRLLQVLLDLPAPAYRHHRLILDDEGKKLAKSRDSKTLRDLRAEGATPADIRRMVGIQPASV
ncbi:MAG: tRNA glutamyl-Q(34) synthetase GluQRS [Rhodoblastus sp.]